MAQNPPPPSTSQQGVPQQGVDRLRRMATTEGGAFFTSDFSVSEFLLVKEAGFDPLGLQLRVAAAKTCEVLDPRDLEPDEVDGVMRDALRVRLGEANLHLGREAEVHG